MSIASGVTKRNPSIITGGAKGDSLLAIKYVLSQRSEKSTNLPNEQA